MGLEFSLKTQPTQPHNAQHGRPTSTTTLPSSRVTPSGSVSFVSKLYAGRISDKRITQLYGILTLLDKGDIVLADKGFDIAEEVTAVKAELLKNPAPPYFSQLPPPPFSPLATPIDT